MTVYRRSNPNAGISLDSTTHPPLLDLLLTDDQPWMARGLCAQTDPESFFPEKGGSTAGAKRVCWMCDVRPDCLAYALDNDERFGIWGGLSERERRSVKSGKPVTVPEPRPCAFPGCEQQIPAHVHRGRKFCSPAHDAPFKRARATARAATAGGAQ